MPTSKAKKGGLVALVGASAAVLMTGTVAKWEGKSNKPYADLVNKMTVCFGETNVPMRYYTDAECEEMLGESLTGYAKGVLTRNPTLRNHPEELAAATSLAYNIGSANYNRSTVAKRFERGDHTGACDAFLMWRYAGGREVKGLLNRRRDERKLCLSGVGK